MIFHKKTNDFLSHWFFHGITFARGIFYFLAQLLVYSHDLYSGIILI